MQAADAWGSVLIALKPPAAGAGGIARGPNRGINVFYGGGFSGAGRGVFGRPSRKGRWSLPLVSRAA